MKINTVKQFYLTADYYSYVDTVSGNTTIRTYSFDSEIKFKGSINPISEFVFYCDLQLLLAGQLKIAKDRAGTLISPGTIWQITQAQPVINPLGYFDGYKYKAKVV
jgi:hypothetical protein